MKLFTLSADLKLETKSFQDGITKARQKAEEAKTAMQKIGEGTQKAEEGLKSAANAAQKMVTEASKLSQGKRGAEELAHSTEKVQKGAKNAQESIEKMDDSAKKPVKLDADTRSILEKINGVQSAMQKMQSMAQKIANIIKVAAVAKAIEKVGTYVAQTGIEYTSELESYEAQLGVLMGGADKAAEKMKDLSEMAAKTPYDLADVADAAAKLLTYGESSDTVTDTVRRLGDIALGSTDKLETLTRAFGKMRTTGKVTTEQLTVMQEAGFNPLTLIAEKYQMTQEKVNEALSDGKIPLSEIEWAIRKATDAGGQFYNGSATLAETLSGRIATLSENWRSFLGQLTKPAFNVLKDTVLPYAIDLVDRLSKSLDEDGVQGALSTLGTEVSNLGKTVASKINTYFDSDEAKTDLQSATGKIVALMTGGNILLSDVTSFITNVLAKIDETFTDETVKTNLVNTGTQLIKGILTFETGKIDTIISGLSVAGNIATGLLQGISDYLSTEEGVTAITSIVSSLGTAIVNLGQTAINAIPALVSAGAAIFEGIATAAANNITTFFDTFSVEDFLASASTWWDKVKPGLEKILQANVSIVYTLYKNVVGAVFGEEAEQEIDETREKNQQINAQLVEDGIDVYSGATPTAQELLDAAGKVNAKSYATGLYNVPYDGYAAILHAGERVLTKAQADESRRPQAQTEQPIVVNNYIQTVTESPSETAAYIKQAMRTLRFNQT